MNSYDLQYYILNIDLPFNTFLININQYSLPNDASGIVQSRDNTVKPRSCDEYLL